MSPTTAAWSGVERLFLQIEATRVEPTHDILLAGAHAARALGDVRASQARLERALMLQENEEVVSWLNEIHQHYGTVFIACQAKRKPARLDSAERPFSPMLQPSLPTRSLMTTSGLMVDAPFSATSLHSCTA